MRRDRFRALALCLPVICLSSLAMSTAALAEDRMMDHGSGMGGMGVGTGIGIGLGVGLGQALSHPPAAQPVETDEPRMRREIHHVSKKRGRPEPEAVSKSDKPAKSDTALTFDGKPDGIGHISSHHGGDMGTQSKHQSVLVLRDGEYYRRGYYSASDGKDTNWYWYEVPISKDSPVTSKLPYVASCSKDADTCVLTKRSDTPVTDELRNDQAYAGWWWWLDEPYGPVVKVNKRAQYCKKSVTAGPPLGISCDPKAPGDDASSCTSGCAVVGPEMGGAPLPSKSNYGVSNKTAVNVSAAWTAANPLGAAPPFNAGQFDCRCIGATAPQDGE